MLGRGDIILETPRQRLPRGVQQPQRAIAVAHPVHQHAKGHDVGDLFKVHMALGHLAPDRIGMLLAARNLDVQARLGQGLLQRLAVPPA